MKEATLATVKAVMREWPGKRGVDIPEHVFDDIHRVANGITQPLWGRRPTPEQLHWLYTNGHHTPEQIHQAFDGLPHPHAPNMAVGQYRDHAEALKVYKQHR